jgi:hypothetical protein
MCRASLLCVLLCCALVHAGDDKKEPELKWAKGILADFLQSVKSQEFDQAELLMTKEFKQALDKYQAVISSGMKGWFMTKGAPGDTWEITSEEMSPDRDEIVLRGLFKKEKEEAEFSARVVKECDGGKWRVSYLHCGGWLPIKPAVKKN